MSYFFGLESLSLRLRLRIRGRPLPRASYGQHADPVLRCQILDYHPLVPTALALVEVGRLVVEVRQFAVMLGPQNAVIFLEPCVVPARRSNPPRKWDTSLVLVTLSAVM